MTDLPAHYATSRPCAKCRRLLGDASTAEEQETFLWLLGALRERNRRGFAATDEHLPCGADPAAAWVPRLRDRRQLLLPQYGQQF